MKDISWQVLQGVRLMHKESCVHGDIKPSVSSSPIQQLPLPAHQMDEADIFR